MIVQARDRAGNVFAETYAPTAEAAVAIAECWHRADPALYIEIMAGDRRAREQADER